MEVEITSSNSLPQLYFSRYGKTGTKNVQQCSAILLQNGLNSDVARFITDEKNLQFYLLQDRFERTTSRAISLFNLFCSNIAKKVELSLFPGLEVLVL